MRTYKYKIRTHPKNKRLGNMFDDLADVHNHFLKLEKRYYRIYGKYAGRYRMQPHLTKLLKRTKKHWAWIPRDTLDTAIIRIDDAYQRFFNGQGGPPKPIGLSDNSHDTIGKLLINALTGNGKLQPTFADALILSLQKHLTLTV
ncbi:hypothetical protein C6501_17510 [Candidatus Poribacteria bacterium]|nr:MAG: hypothetical protein C6501_17510 [Candidatus Poribacteria bacterium]